MRGPGASPASFRAEILQEGYRIMRAFKQFLSLVLVTCMLTSMFTIVSAAGPQVYARTWDSDSGHITIQQGESGQSVDSGYRKGQDSGYTVQVDLDAEKAVQVDLSSEEQVQITVTGQNLEGQYELKVLDSGNNLVYVPEMPSDTQPNTPAENESDNQKITFEVPPISMAGGSKLEISSAGDPTPAWRISYYKNVTGSVTTDESTPAEIPTVPEEGSTSVTVPAAAVEAVLNNVSGQEAYVQVEASDKDGRLLLDTSVFNHDKFKNGSLTLNITVKVDGISYTWKFTAKSAQTFALLAETRGDDSQKIDLMPKIVKDKFGDNQIPGEKVTIDVSKLSDDMIAELTVPTAVASDKVKVFSNEQGAWVDSGVESVTEEGSVTFEVSKAASEYAIVASDVTAEQMNGTKPEPDYAITIQPDEATIQVGKTTSLKAVVTKDDQTLSDAAVTWTTSDSKVATVNNGTVTAVAEGPATITATYTPTDGKPCTAEAVITVTEDEPEITIKLDPTVRFVYIGRAPVTLTATVTGTDEKAVFTTEDNGLILLTDNGDNTATVKGLKEGDTTVTATVGGKTATCKILVRVYHGGGSGGGSSSGGGGGSWNDGSHGSSMPSAGSGTTTTPGTGTTTPGTGTSGNAQPQGCVSDTVGNFSVKGSYQYKLTSTNGQAPAVTVSNSNFRVVLASQNGKDYFFKVYAIGAVGQTCDVLVNGTKVSTVTASEVYGGVSCDTTAPFTVKKGGSYQFKLTASSKPVMAAGSSSFRVEYVGNSGNDWFFKVYAVGNAGDGCGFYVNGAPFTVAVAHIGE